MYVGTPMMFHHQFGFLKPPSSQNARALWSARSFSGVRGERAITRMVQAGAVPITSVQYLLELQRDWARAETYDLTTGIARDHAGGYGVGIQYAKTMFGAQEGGH